MLLGLKLWWYRRTLRRREWNPRLYRRQLRAVKALRGIDHPGAITLLREALGSNVLGIIIEATRGLHARGIGGVSDRLLAWLERNLTDKRLTIHHDLVLALGEVGERRAIPLLMTCLLCADSGDRVPVAQALAALGDDRWVKVVRGDLHDMQRILAVGAGVVKEELLRWAGVYCGDSQGPGRLPYWTLSLVLDALSQDPDPKASEAVLRIADVLDARAVSEAKRNAETWEKTRQWYGGADVWHHAPSADPVILGPLLNALGRLSDPRAHSRVIEYLAMRRYVHADSQKPQVAALAARVLCKVGKEEAVVRALKRDTETREILKHLDPPEAARLAEKAGI